MNAKQSIEIDVMAKEIRMQVLANHRLRIACNAALSDPCTHGSLSDETEKLLREVLFDEAVEAVEREEAKP